MVKNTKGPLMDSYTSSLEVHYNYIACLHTYMHTVGLFVEITCNTLIITDYALLL